MNKWTEKILPICDKIGDLFFLNILYIICCIPIVTIGTATAALYSLTLQMTEKKESYIAKAFLQNCKIHFKTATIIWLLFLLFICTFYFDYYYIGLLPSAAGYVFGILITVIFMILLCISSWLFPTISLCSASVAHTLKSACISCFSHPIQSFIMLFMNCFFLGVFLFNLKLFFSLLPFILIIGFSGVAYINSKILRQCS